MPILLPLFVSIALSSALYLLTRGAETDEIEVGGIEADHRAYLRALRREERRGYVPTRTLYRLATLYPDDAAAAERTLHSARAILARRESA